MAGTRLPEVEARCQPRRGIVGVAARDELPADEAHSRLVLCVKCPECTGYATIVGNGAEYANITTMLRPEFECSTCSFAPTAPSETPHSWTVWYSGRLRGTLLWAVNEDHLNVLERYLETNPKRRPMVEFDAVYLRLMQRLPPEVESGRSRSDAVSMIKRLRRAAPR